MKIEDYTQPPTRYTLSLKGFSHWTLSGKAW